MSWRVRSNSGVARPDRDLKGGCPEPRRGLYALQGDFYEKTCEWPPPASHVWRLAAYFRGRCSRRKSPIITCLDFSTTRVTSFLAQFKIETHPDYVDVLELHEVTVVGVKYTRCRHACDVTSFVKISMQEVST